MSNQNTQLSLRNEIESPAFRDAVAKVLPKILPPERFVRVACTAFSSIVMASGGSGWPLIGWNIFGFDLPFILRRSWILGVALPEWIRNGRYWDRCFVDAMDVWACGNRDQAVGLDLAAATLGVGRKSGSGAHFASLWGGSDEERAHALEYLENDLRLTKSVAERIIPAGSRVIERRAA